jgi:hypothetical protein
LDLHLRIRSSRDDVGLIQQPQDAILSRALRSRLSFLFQLTPLLAIFLISCGGLVSSGPPPPVTVTVSPASAQPFTGDQVHFTANVQNAASPAVTWQVDAMPGGNPTVGMIDSFGVYTAPGSVPTTSPTVTVTAVLQSDSTKAGSAIVTVKPLSTIQSLSISPKLSSVTTSQSLQLQVTASGVNNNLNNFANWTVGCAPPGNCSTGTIDQSGLFRPPNVASHQMILASLIVNPSVRDLANIEVTDFAGTFTWRNDNSRSGQNQKELALAPINFDSSTFGKLFSCPLDGYAYAQPLYVANLAIPGDRPRNVVFVATEKDSVFAFDADANPCVPLWKTSLIPVGEEAVPTPTPNEEIPSKDIVPFIGITGTPVIDVSSSYLYVVAETRTTASFQHDYVERLYALDLATGQPKIRPTGVQISTPNSVSPIFNPLLANQRAALLLDSGNIYVAFASHQDPNSVPSTYSGWLLGYDASTLPQNPNLVFNVTPNNLGGGIWQSGGGPSADSNHNVYLATGRGTFDVNLGAPDYGESFVRLNMAGPFSVDYFTPCDQAMLFAKGQDIGSSAPVLLPDSPDFVSPPHLMVGAGKDGSLYVLDRDNLGKYNPPCPDSVARVQVVPVGDGPILSTPLFRNNLNNDFIYVAAGNGKLKAFPITAGVLNPTPLASQSLKTLGPQGATPVLSSNGANNAIIWLIDARGALDSPNTPAILRAFDAGDLSNEIYNSTTAPADRDKAGLAVKFTVPTVANGKVYVGTQTELDVYGLLH